MSDIQPVARPLVRWDPFRTYQFRFGFDVPPASEYVGGVKRVSGLNMTIAAHEIREGGNSLHRYANPDRATWDPITLEQGIALNDTLERWAQAAVEFLRTGLRPEEPVKRNVFIDVWDPAALDGSRLRRYRVFNAWVSRLQAIPQLDAMANEVALLTVELTHEGWKRVAPPFPSPEPAPQGGG